MKTHGLTRLQYYYFRVSMVAPHQAVDVLDNERHFRNPVRLCHDAMTWNLVGHQQGGRAQAVTAVTSLAWSFESQRRRTA